jgi:hypothetical protein
MPKTLTGVKDVTVKPAFRVTEADNWAWEAGGNKLRTARKTGEICLRNKRRLDFTEESLLTKKINNFQNEELKKIYSHYQATPLSFPSLSTAGPLSAQPKRTYFTSLASKGSSTRGPLRGQVTSKWLMVARPFFVVGGSPTLGKSYAFHIKPRRRLSF